jgi:hypothetical protein
MKYWEVVADKLSAAGWSWGYCSAVTCWKLLHLILGFGFRDRLPLHVGRTIAAAALQWDNVIHDVTGAAIWVPRHAHELSFGGFVPLNSAVVIALNA